MKVGFTVRDLIERLEEGDIPEDAVVFLESGTFVKAAESLSVVRNAAEYPILAIQARSEHEKAKEEN